VANDESTHVDFSRGWHVSLARLWEWCIFCLLLPTLPKQEPAKPKCNTDTPTQALHQRYPDI